MTNVTDLKMWLVEIHEDDWDYDQFVEAAVWAESAEEAERAVRAEPRTRAFEYGTSPKEDKLWINPHWRLSVREAPTKGVVLVHWHAG